MIDNTILAINSAWRSTGAVLYGIATSMTKQTEDSFYSVPAVIDQHGECQYPDPEDENPVTIYHRIAAKGYINSRGFGDGKGLIVTYDMKAICFGMRGKVRLSVDEVEQSLVAIMPSNASGYQIEVVSSDFDQQRIFAEEFQNVEPFLNPSMFLFAIRYKVVKTFNSKNCAINLLKNNI